MYTLLSVGCRPSFKYFTWHTAFIGLVGTLVMMFLINSIYASTSVLLCLILVIILHLFSPSREAHWGSISQALIFHQVITDVKLLEVQSDRHIQTHAHSSAVHLTGWVCIAVTL
jgi:potassium/chloride transporter 9